MQETFLRAWRASDRYDPQLGSLRTWLFTIARNVMVDLARARTARLESGGAREEEGARAEGEEPS